MRKSAGCTAQNEENLSKIFRDVGDPLWHRAQPYLADITEHDLALLAAQTEEPDATLLSVPQLGKPYWQVWEDRCDGPGLQAAGQSNRSACSKTASQDGTANESSTGRESDLLHNLRRALLSTDEPETLDVPTNSESATVELKPFQASPSLSLKERILCDLVAAGIVANEQKCNDVSADELLEELIQFQGLLAAVACHNSRVVERLQGQARRFASKQQVYTALQNAEEDFVRLYSDSADSSDKRSLEDSINLRKALEKVKSLTAKYKKTAKG